MKLTDEVKADLAAFLDHNLPYWQADLPTLGFPADDDPCMELTVACTESGDAWNYQTGDNSYTGGAYGLPHWAVVSVTEDSTPAELLEEIESQLEDLLNSW